MLLKKIKVLEEWSANTVDHYCGWPANKVGHPTYSSEWLVQVNGQLGTRGRPTVVTNHSSKNSKKNSKIQISVFKIQKLKILIFFKFFEEII